MATYQFPGTDFHDANLDWIINQVKQCLTEWAATKEDWEHLRTDNAAFVARITEEWETVRQYIDSYFANLDVTEEISDKVDAMAADGSLLQIIHSTVQNSSGAAATAWMQENITQETGYVIDKSLTVADAAADAKAAGDVIGKNTIRINEIMSELFDNKIEAGAYMSGGGIGPDGTAKAQTAYTLRKIDVHNIVGELITAYSSKAESASATIVMFAFYDIDYDDITRSTATAEHCVGMGNQYTPGIAQIITEQLVVPTGAKTMLLSWGGDSSARHDIEYPVSLGIKDAIVKKPYAAGNIFFTVDCDRPIPFGGEVGEQTTETVECVLRLPTTYTPAGSPTRLVLACHGATGYIDAANDIWYNSNWNSLMNALTNAGYAVFDANIFGGETVEDNGFALGSPLYVQVLKKAYNYIVTNYNVHKQIFAHGTSMGGVGARTFAHFYPELVLAVSLFAGRDICKYIHTISIAGNVPNDGNFSKAYGYVTDAELLEDHFSHVVGMSDSLGIMKIENGSVIYPPDRDTNFTGWLDYYAEINKQTKTNNFYPWMGNNLVPTKSWNDWADDEGDTAQELLMQSAFAKTNSKPYYAVVYDSNYTHTQMCYGQVEDMRTELIAWFKRWE